MNSVAKTKSPSVSILKGKSDFMKMESEEIINEVMCVKKKKKKCKNFQVYVYLYCKIWDSSLLE